jgi:hypothetical protein
MPKIIDPNFAVCLHICSVDAKYFRRTRANALANGILPNDRERKINSHGNKGDALGAPLLTFLLSFFLRAARARALQRSCQSIFGTAKINDVTEVA